MDRDEKINEINSDSVTQFGSSVVKKLDKTKELRKNAEQAIFLRFSFLNLY